MIAVLLSWCVMVGIFLSLGRMVALLFDQIGGNRGNYTFFDLFFIGLCSTGVVISISSLFVPSGVWVMLALIVASACSWGVCCQSGKELIKGILTKWKGLSVFQLVAILVVAIIFLSFAIMPPQLPDTFYYHIQNIMWNEEYRVVPGLANLIEQFGFNSNYFLLSSVFGLKPLFGEFVYGLNALCSVVVCSYFIVKYGDTTRNRILSFLGMGICFFFFLEYKIHFGSPSTDILPSVIIIYLLSIILRDRDLMMNKLALFWIVPIFCITLKLSSIFICIIPIYIIVFFVRRNQYRAVLMMCTSVIIILLPWLVRNVIVSGYLIYPFPAIDIFDVDWKLPMEYVVESKKYVKAYAISVEALHQSSDYVLNLPFAEQVRLWIKDQPFYDILLMCCAILSPILVAMFYVKRQIYFASILCWGIAFLGFAFGLIMAPAIRFGFGFIVMASVIPLFYCLEKSSWTERFFSLKWIRIVPIIILGIAGLLSVRYYISVRDSNVSFISVCYKPQGLETTSAKKGQVIEVCRINNLDINVPIKYSSLDYALPTSTRFVDNIEMRGQSLQEGFRVGK